MKNELEKQADLNFQAIRSEQEKKDKQSKENMI